MTELILKNTLWQTIINQWCTVYGRYGLTLPFIIGAEKEYGRGSAFTIKTLFIELQASQQPYVISQCSDLEEYIIGLPKTEYPYLGSLPKYGSLYINNQTLEDLASIEAIQGQLKFMYEKFILESKYSKSTESEKWISFTDADIKTIKNAMK